MQLVQYVMVHNAYIFFFLRSLKFQNTTLMRVTFSH